MPSLPPPPPTSFDASKERRQFPRIAFNSVSRGPTQITINHGATFLVAAQDGSIRSADGQEQGVYSDDTRFVSHHVVRLNGKLLIPVSASRLSFRHARWHFVCPDIELVNGVVAGGSVSVTIDRVISARRLHEDIIVRSYAQEPCALQLTVAVECDFADIFEVRTRKWQRRNSMETMWHHSGRLETAYERNGFVRRCLIRTAPSEVKAGYANGDYQLPVDLDPGGTWRVCLQYDLLTSKSARPLQTGCTLQKGLDDRAEQLRRHWHKTVTSVQASDPKLQRSYEQAVEDFAALRLYDHDFSREVWVPAAGIPWFVALFGRDSIIASLQALPVHPFFAVGTLQKLASMQSTVDDPVRDAEPGKILHEMRVGEWSQFHVIPHSPYFGTADATPLYLYLLGETYRWLGDAAFLERFRPNALRCLEWIDQYGDRDGDGFQEYAPRSPSGYRNQSWRDAEDGVLDEDGAFPDHPIAMCEMQAYVYAAKHAAADLFEAWGDTDRAGTLRSEALQLRQRFMEAFWIPEQQQLAFCLDGNKRKVATVASNPGHCLWLGIVDGQRADLMIDRLMRKDLFSGWGIRTLSATHPAYNPHSYQRGSVWPHDTIIAADGCKRYGRINEAWRLIEGILSATTSLEDCQAPELFAGLARSSADAPVPYLSANVPQAWSAGSIFQITRILLGLHPDVPNGTIYLDPTLPPWCPRLEMRNLRLGNDRVEIKAWRKSDGSSDFSIDSPHHFTVVRGAPPWRSVRAD